MKITVMIPSCSVRDVDAEDERQHDEVRDVGDDEPTAMLAFASTKDMNGIGSCLRLLDVRWCTARQLSDTPGSGGRR